jgi:hypothetical protein
MALATSFVSRRYGFGIGDAPAVTYFVTYN